MILKTFYEEINFTAGEKFCRIHLRDSNYIQIYNLNESLIYPEITSRNSLINIIHQQLTLKFHKFVQITKKFTQTLENDIEVKVFATIEALEECKFDEAAKLLQSFVMNDDNEIILRILKGNFLYSTHNQWGAVCEFEIAYNLCLKSKAKFPHMPALRCGLWYLHEMKNLTKARRYLHYCCKNFSTFNSWNGLGLVNFLEMSYSDAEKYLNCANQIYRNCGDNWIYLALVNCKLKRMDTALSCYLTAKNCGVEDREILYETERELKI